MRFTKIFSILLVFFIFTGCETTSKVDEQAISIELKGTSVEIQNFIEKNLSNSHGKYAKDLRVVNADSRSITFSTDCTNVSYLGVVSCTLTKSLIGNTGWNDMVLNIIYRTNEIRGVTVVKLETKLCTSNMIGSNTKCLDEGGNERRNRFLLDLKNDYESQVKK
jgi:hypothetical protein